MSALSKSNGEARKLASLPPWMESLRAAVDAELKGDDLQGIVRAFVDKAKKGDERAARFVIEYLMGGKFAPTEVTIHNHFGGSAEAEEKPLRTVESYNPTPQDLVVNYLEAAGKAKPAVIAADVNLPLKTVTGILNSKRFTRDGEFYLISHAG